MQELGEVPVIRTEYFRTDEDRRAFALAENRIASGGTTRMGKPVSGGAPYKMKSLPLRLVTALKVIPKSAAPAPSTSPDSVAVVPETT